MLFTERNFTLSVRLADGTVRKLQRPRDFTDKLNAFEIGLMAIVVDPDFAGNRRFYTCQSHWDTNRAAAKIQVISWTVNAGYTKATRVKDPLVGGIPIRAGGRHGGCRLRFGPENYLWIATGDAAMPTVPQDLNSLGGKVLRVDRTTGAGAPDNPFESGGAKTRIYTYGHRNPQGLALRPGTGQMWSVEHGPHRHDEVNLLVKGGNYGFDPVDPDRPASYAERSVPMTDRSKFPDAVPAKWSSGRYGTLATSGGIFLEGEQWGAWNGWLAVAALREAQLRLLRFTPDGTLINETIVPELHGRFGRLRTPMMGPDGALYVTTSNAVSFAGSPPYADRILRVFVQTPGSAPGAPSELSATVGDGRITLTWSAPSDGGSRIIRYEYRYAVSGGPYGEWSTVPGGAGETSVTIDDLTNGTEYRFEVRAVNGAGSGKASGVEATPMARIDFPHFANGRQSDGTAITSDIVLVNVETWTVHPAISFYDQQGERVNAETVVEMTEDLEVVENGVLTAARGIEGKSEITISTHGEGPLVIGSVRVIATGRMGGVLRFDIPRTGVAGVGAGEAVREAIFPARRMADGINTGAAIRNLSAESMTVTCYLMQRGEVMGTTEIGLAGDGHSSRFLHELFPEADTSSFVGSVRCAAEEGGMFTAVALELDAGNGIFTTLPVAPVGRGGRRRHVDAEFRTFRQRRVRRGGHEFRPGVRERGQHGRGSGRPLLRSGRQQDRRRLCRGPDDGRGGGHRGGDPDRHGGDPDSGRDDDFHPRHGRRRRRLGESRLGRALGSSPPLRQPHHRCGRSGSQRNRQRRHLHGPPDGGRDQHRSRPPQPRFGSDDGDLPVDGGRPEAGRGGDLAGRPRPELQVHQRDLHDRRHGGLRRLGPLCRARRFNVHRRGLGNGFQQPDLHHPAHGPGHVGAPLVGALFVPNQSNRRDAALPGLSNQPLQGGQVLPDGLQNPIPVHGEPAVAAFRPAEGVLAVKADRT